jgi:hypothetical protein
MRPTISSREDVQPNERRPNRKGVTDIPTIRLTTPRRGVFQGRLQSSQGSGSTYANRASWTPRSSAASQFPSRGRGITNHSPASASFSGPSRYPAVPYQHSTRVTQYNTSKRLSPFPDARQPKRPRLTNSPPQPRLDSPSAPSPVKKPTKKHKGTSRVEIRLNIPLYCRTGVHGCRQSRRMWLDQQIQRIEQERPVKVYGTQYLDQEVLLFCDPEKSQDISVCTDSPGISSCSCPIRLADNLASQLSEGNKLMLRIWIRGCLVSL